MKFIQRLFSRRSIESKSMPKFMDNISCFHSSACIIPNNKRKFLIWQHTACKQVVPLILPCFQIVQFLLHHLIKITSRFIGQILKHGGNSGNQFPGVCGDCGRSAKINSLCFDFSYCRRNIFLNMAAEVRCLFCSVVLPSLNVVSEINIAAIAKAVCKLTANFYQLPDYIDNLFRTNGVYR